MPYVPQVKTSETETSTIEIVAKYDASYNDIAVTYVPYSVYNMHVNNHSNPHNVTATQVGAIPTTGGTLSGNITLTGYNGNGIVWNGSGNIALREGPFVMTSSNGYGTIGLGDPARNFTMGLVVDQNNRRFYIETLINGTSYKLMIPLYVNGTIQVV